MSQRQITEKRKIYTRWKVSEHRRTTKQKAIKYKGNQCSKCGYNKCIGAMHFHHQSPEHKDFGIGNGSTKSWEKIKIELDKCILLCANCHAEEHQIEIDKKVEIKRAKMKILFPKMGEPRKSKNILSCFECNTEIEVLPSALRKHNFCSRSCRVEYFRYHGWPSDEEVLKLTKENSIASVSRMIGKSTRSIYKRLKRIKTLGYNVTVA